MFFKFLPFEGPARYCWKDPDTGREFEEKTKDDLITRITSYRLQNNLEEIEHLSFVLEAHWCSLPENAGKCVPIEATPRGTLGYLKGGLALLKTLMYKAFATQEVADSRAAVCLKCPFNVFPDKGGFIKWSNDIAVATIGERKAKGHEELGQCAVCSCPLRAKVFYTGSVERNPDWVHKMEAVGCWQLNLMRKDG